MPAPVVFQAMGGPAAGQSFSKPRSAEMPSRFGPRHWGQSSKARSDATAESDRTTVTARRRFTVAPFAQRKLRATGVGMPRATGEPVERVPALYASQAPLRLRESSRSHPQPADPQRPGR